MSNKISKRTIMTDTYPTTDKTLEVTYIGHASVMFRYGDEIIHRGQPAVHDAGEK